MMAVTSQGLAVSQHFCPGIYLNFIISGFLSQTSLSNMELIRHPIFVTGLFVTIIISISKQHRQTVSVSGRMRPFLSSYVHIQKQQFRIEIEGLYCKFVIEQK